MTSGVGGARVEIEGDVSSLASQVERDLNEALSSIRVDPASFQPVSEAASSSAENVSEAFGEAASESNEALEQVEGDFTEPEEGAASASGAIGDEFGEAADSAEDSAGNISDSMTEAADESESSMTAAARSIRTALVAVGAAVAAAGTAMVAAAFNAAGFAGELETQAFQIGVTTDALQDLQFWAQQNGIEASTLERAVGRLNQRIGLAAEGNDTYAEAFQNIDVAIQDTQGNLRDTEAVLGDTVEALLGIEDPQRRVAAATEIFGTRVARQLTPALQEGSLTLKDATEAMDDIGRVTEDQIASAGQFGALWDEIKFRVMSMLREAAFPLVEWMANELFPAINNVIPVISDLVSRFSDALGPAMERIGPIIGAVASFLADTLGPVIESMSGVLSNFFSSLGSGSSQASDFQDAISSIIDVFQSLFETARPIVEQLFAILGPALENIGQIIVNDLVPAFADFIQAIRPALEFLIEFIGGALIGAFEGAVTAIQGALEIITGIFNVFAGLFTGDWDQLWEGVKQIFSGVWETIQGLFQFFINFGIIRALRAGISLITNLWRRGWDTVRNFVTGIFNRVRNVISRGINTFTRIVRTGVGFIIRGIGRLISVPRRIIEFFGRAVSGARGLLGDLVTFVRSVPGRILRALGNLGRLLFDIGKSIFQGLLDGLLAAWRNVTGFVGSVAGKIKELKGPLDEDKVLLQDEGQAIMQGLQQGLSDEIPNLERLLGGVTDDISSSIRPEIGRVGGDGAEMPMSVRVFVGNEEIKDIARVEARGEIDEHDRTIIRQVPIGGRTR